MEGVQVGRDARLRRVVVDQGVAIPAGMEIGLDEGQDGRNFTVSRESGVVAIPRGSRLESPENRMDSMEQIGCAVAGR
jgi:glucose-1-phosphate adenylyltransferase